MMLYLAVALIPLVSLGGLYFGWNRNALRLAIWGGYEESLREYVIKKLSRLGLLICLIVLLLVAAHFIATAALEETNNEWSVGVVIASLILPSLAALIVSLFWWLSEFLGCLFRRSMQWSRRWRSLA